MNKRLQQANKQEDETKKRLSNGAKLHCLNFKYFVCVFVCVFECDLNQHEHRMRGNPHLHIKLPNAIKLLCCIR